jgi:4-amino-4-deoxy-L-arabinose transferase-like glycosyltransferase
MRMMSLSWPWTRKNQGADASNGALVRGQRWPLLALGAIVLLAAILRFSDLASLGYVNSYYTAAVKAMLQSWHNFIFVAAEPGGSVSIDKPPVGLWLQAISAAVFGVNTLGVLLPQLLAGMASVVVLYHLVQRRFGQLAGLVAGLALAITPVVVATDRNNTMDSTLVFTMLLAAWAFIKATESRKLKWLLLGAALTGIGFNIKMMQAYLALPAFYALYFLGAKEAIWRKLRKLALATVLLVVVSLSWVTAVDLTPASQRPYVGSSGDNSALSLALGYNGLQRLLGQRSVDVGAGSITAAVTRLFEGGSAGDGGFGGGRGGFGGPGGGPGGMFQTGQPGALRLFTGEMSNQISWLLPFGLFSVALLLFRSRLRWPVSEKHQAVVLWGGWLLTGAVFFSIAGFFHPYYLTTLGPPLAAMVGLGVAELWSMRGIRLWLAVALALTAIGGTVVLQYKTASNFTKGVWWAPFAVLLLVVGVFLFAAGRKLWPGAVAAGFACLVAALLLTPAVWSGLTTTYSKDSLPTAYTGQSRGGFGGPGGGPGGGPSGGPSGGPGAEVEESLISYLQANTRGMRYMMAVPGANQGAGYVNRTGRGVLYLGGFNGSDQVETPESMAQLVAGGQLRYVYLGGGRGFGGPGGRSNVTNWVTSNCTPVEDAGIGNLGNSLYDCSPGA